METKIGKMVKDLEKALAPTDTIYIDRLVEYYEARHKAMRDYQEQNRRTTIADDYMYYRELHAVSGGKTLYNQLQYEPAPYYASQDKNSSEYDPTKPLFGYDENGRNDSVKNLAIKNAKRTLKARNFRLAFKLKKEEVTEILDSQVKYTTDGFHGTYKVNTNNGPKTIKLETIVAGGYNIQCAHYRTLINFLKEVA
tara:strand:- start:827 stop:1414 length:588 start_codon:yes stop_codon:yes gene_type:complete